MVEATKNKNKLAFEMWYRQKEHQSNLRTVLIREAK